MSPGLGHTYLVCATPRSGSTLLCEMLRETGRAGNPLEHFETLRHTSLPRQPREYFSGAELPGVLERLPPVQPGAPSSESPEAWWRRIVAEGRTDNGVWGGKLMWGHTDELLARARALPGLEGASLETALRALLTNPLLIFVTRGDKVAQAVSLWRALQTQSWRSEDASAHPAPSYHFAAIDYLIEQLRADEQAWMEWFRRTGFDAPIDVSYEQLDTAPEAVVTNVLVRLGLTGGEVSAPPLSRQRDELSSAWSERYRSERERAA